MPLYNFRLVDSIAVSGYGTHELLNDVIAEREAHKLARSLRETRPELRLKHYSISVTRDDGTGVCVIPLDLH
jgi:hypothetical protein